METVEVKGQAGVSQRDQAVASCESTTDNLKFRGQLRQNDKICSSGSGLGLFSCFNLQECLRWLISF